MPEENVPPPPKKSSFLVTAVIISVILAMSAAFFWAGNFFYGVIMIAIPVLSIIISAGCYVAHKNQPAVEQFVLGDVEFRHPVDENGIPGIADQPPEYRMTWRRSFIKRMRHLRQSGHNGTRDAEQGNEEEGAELSERRKQTLLVTQLSDAPSSAPSEGTVKELAPGEGLPSYDEALEIIASRENLSAV